MKFPEVMNSREATLFLEIEFLKHKVSISAIDLLDDVIRFSESRRRGYPQLAVAKQNGRRYYRKSDLRTLAEMAIHKAGGKPPKMKRPDPSKLIFSYHMTGAERDSFFYPLH